MAIMRNQPYPGSNFLVDLGTGDTQGPDAGLLEVVFPESRVEVIEYRNGNAKTNEVVKIQSLIKYGNVTLKRGVIGSLSWYEWWNEIRNGVQSVRNVTVSLENEDHSAIVLTWGFIRARPVMYQFSPLNGMGCEAFTETLELAFERLEVE